MNRTLMLLATATLTLAALPASASAATKLRGCDYRLRGVTEAEITLSQAEQRGIGVAEARAQLARARDAAYEEGCFVESRREPRIDSRIEHARWDGWRERRWANARERQHARFDYLVSAGLRRGLSRAEFAELVELGKRFDF